MQAVIDWIVAHQAVVSGSVVGVLDLVFALNSSASSNGVLHWIYLQAQKLSGKTPAA